MAQTVKNLPAMWETWFDPWVSKIPWRRAWQLIPVFLPAECHGEEPGRLYSPQGHEELDVTEMI